MTERATKDFPTPIGPKMATDATWFVRSNTSFTIPSREKKFVGVCGGIGGVVG